MLLVIDNETILSVDKVKSMFIKNSSKKEKVEVSNFFGFFPQYEEVLVESHTLVFDYFYNGSEWTFTSEHNTKQGCLKVAKSLIDELKKKDPSIIDAAFEEAFLK